MNGVLQDLRFGVRMLVRSPGFALAAILALGLGIGASTSVFTVLDGVVLRPLPYADPEQLVTIWDASSSRRLSHETVSPVTFLDDRQLTQVFQDAAAWWRPNFNLTDAGRDPVRVNAIEVSANFFSVLGVQPALGAGFPATPFFNRMIGEPVDRPRLLTTIMTVFAGLALSLAALGIYGVMSYAVNQRRQELSVRVALGAERGSIVWLVVRQGLALAGLGIVVGALGGHAVGRVMSGLLYGVTATDLPTFAAVPAIVAAVALTACLLPARRAAAADPIQALRGD